MTIPPDRESEILRLFHAEHWPVGTIAAQLGFHHSVVRRVLEKNGTLVEPDDTRPGKADPYLPFIIETLEQYPRLHASRLYDMVAERGYTGSQGHFRRIVRRHRPRKAAEAFQRLRTLPGQQAQVDWASFGKIVDGQAVRPLVAFVMVLSYSRRIFLRFYRSQGMACFLAGHVEAFDFFGGVPRELLYDNLKSAVLERAGNAIRFNPTLLALAGHYRFQPKPVAVARGNEKGRVERAIRYARDAFFAARKYRDLDDLNEQARRWCLGQASNRPCPEDRTRSVADVFNEETGLLLPLPAVPFPAHEQVVVRVGKTPYARFDLNDYSVPHTCVRKDLTVVATEHQVRILDGIEVVAEHLRYYDRGLQVEDRSHIQALVEQKQAAGEKRAIDRLHHAVPASKPFLTQLALKQENIGTAVKQLVRLLETHGPVALERAVAEAAAGGSFHLQGVRHVLDRHREARGLPPAIPIPLPDDPRLKDLTIVPHDLAAYDTLFDQDPEARP